MRRPNNIWLLVVVVVCGLSLWLGFGGRDWFRGSDHRDPPLAAEQRTGSAPALGAGSAGQTDSEVNLNPTPIHLVVLNGTGRSGLANEVSLGVVLHGYVIERVGNAPHDDFQKCLLINRRLDATTAADLSESLGGLPVLSEVDIRTTEDAVLVLGQDYPQLLQRLSRVPSSD